MGGVRRTHSPSPASTAGTVELVPGVQPSPWLGDLWAFGGGWPVEALIGAIIQAASRRWLDALRLLANHLGDTRLCGRRTAFHLGPERIARALKRPVYYLSCRRSTPGMYHCTVERIAEPPFGANGAWWSLRRQGAGGHIPCQRIGCGPTTAGGQSSDSGTRCLLATPSCATVARFVPTAERPCFNRICRWKIPEALGSSLAGALSVWATAQRTIRPLQRT